MEGQRGALKLFAPRSEEHQLISPWYGVCIFADAFSVTTILVPCSNVEKPHWIALLHWQKLGFPMDHANHLWGQTNPASSAQRHRGVSRSASRACVLKNSRLLPLLYSCTGRTSALPLAWLNVYFERPKTGAVRCRDGGQNASCSTSSLGPLGLREEMSLPLHSREEKVSERGGWSRTMAPGWTSS